ncbi:hypothetical protein ACFXGA_28410 [Actinosynnema sp. NPDC059335]|uniref:hypothetical protein n=1 Tax=Actinosynnema sp. NPDC059335 TaxID=3346804 RepID=UPI00366D93F9
MLDLLAATVFTFVPSAAAVTPDQASVVETVASPAAADEFGTATLGHDTNWPTRINQTM